MDDEATSQIAERPAVDLQPGPWRAFSRNSCQLKLNVDRISQHNAQVKSTMPAAGNAG